MRSGVAALLATAVVAVAAILGAAHGDQRRLAFTTGVLPTGVAATLDHGQLACQVPVPVGAGFSRVRFQVGTFGRPGQPLELTVRSASSDALLARGRLPGGYADGSQPSVALDRPVPASRRIAVCFRNVSAGKIALYGGGDLAARDTTVVVDGRPRPNDLTLTFERSSSRSALGLVPDMLERASLFRPGWVGRGLLWALALLAALGVPALLGLALRAAGEGDPGDRPQRG